MGLLAMITNGMMGVSETKLIKVTYPLMANIKNKKITMDNMKVNTINQLNLNKISKSLKLETKKPKIVLNLLKKKRVIWK